jgi:hypothetical protein
MRLQSLLDSGIERFYMGHGDPRWMPVKSSAMRKRLSPDGPAPGLSSGVSRRHDPLRTGYY